MNENLNTTTEKVTSALLFEILIDEPWIDKMIHDYKVDIPINEKYILTNLRIGVGEGLLFFVADLKGKEDTSIEVTARPVSNAEKQYLNINDLKLKTDTQNVLIKSAGIFANLFLNEKIDKTIEEQANRQYAQQLEKLKEKPVEIPLANHGAAKIKVSSIFVHELEFLNQAIRMKATIEALPNIHLK